MGHSGTCTAQQHAVTCTTMISSWPAAPQSGLGQDTLKCVGSQPTAACSIGDAWCQPAYSGCMFNWCARCVGFVLRSRKISNGLLGVLALWHGCARSVARGRIRAPRAVPVAIVFRLALLPARVCPQPGVGAVRQRQRRRVRRLPRLPLHPGGGRARRVLDVHLPRVHARAAPALPATLAL